MFLNSGFYHLIKNLPAHLAELSVFNVKCKQINFSTISGEFPLGIHRFLDLVIRHQMEMFFLDYSLR